MKLTLSSQQLKDRACDFIQALSLDRPMLLVISEYKKNRSLAQNSLYFKWVTAIGEADGLLKAEAHHQCKERFLKPIYIRDMTEIAELYNAVRQVWKNGDRDLAEMMNQRITNLISTKDADTKQFSEYLDQIDKDAMQRGIYLERPEDLYREAMNK